METVKTNFIIMQQLLKIDDEETRKAAYIKFWDSLPPDEKREFLTAICDAVEKVVELYNELTNGENFNNS